MPLSSVTPTGGGQRLHVPFDQLSEIDQKKYRRRMASLQSTRAHRLRAEQRYKKAAANQVAQLHHLQHHFHLNRAITSIK
jgi:hypothetical protein